jgi:hypothetical protein
MDEEDTYYVAICYWEGDEDSNSECYHGGGIHLQVLARDVGRHRFLWKSETDVIEELRHVDLYLYSNGRILGALDSEYQTFLRLSREAREDSVKEIKKMELERKLKYDRQLAELKLKHQQDEIETYRVLHGKYKGMVVL